MKKLILVLVAIPGLLSADPFVYEPFDYPDATALTGQGGGSGWNAAWTQDGQSGITAADSLAYTDAVGNLLSVTGRAAATTGSATTRNFRTVATGQLTDVWISFLYLLPASNSKFEGISFYRGATALFSISSSSVDTSSNISLGNTVSGGTVNTQKGQFATTHLVVLHLTEGGGTGGTDKVEAFVDPILSGNPSSPDGSIQSTNFNFDSIRLAGQDGSTLFLDEFRIGDSFADVTPHTPGSVADADNDGLSDAQEAVLGLDPAISDAALIAAIHNHPDYFGLYNSAGILALADGGVILQQTANDPVNFTFEVQHSENLGGWSVFETFNRSIVLPEGKDFLRVTLENP